MKKIPILTLLTFLLFVSNQSIGQVKVLINEVATDVDHLNGNIIASHKQYPNFMNGYESAPFDPFTKVPPRLNDQNYADTSLANTNIASNLTEPVSTPILSSNRVIREDKLVYFIGNTTKLKKNSLSIVSAFSDRIAKGKSKSILITGWYKTDDKASQKLIKERLEACKAKLEKSGVPSNLILTSIFGSNSEKSYLSVIPQ
jgi:outer membrane protein OmpA-like peptidoglycan-associated protein